MLFNMLSNLTIFTKYGFTFYLQLAGILRPNDGNCHLTDSEYADAHLYVSIYHMNTSSHMHDFLTREVTSILTNSGCSNGRMYDFFF